MFAGVSSDRAGCKHSVATIATITTVDASAAKPVTESRCENLVIIVLLREILRRTKRSYFECGAAAQNWIILREHIVF